MGLDHMGQGTILTLILLILTVAAAVKIILSLKELLGGRCHAKLFFFLSHLSLCQEKCYLSLFYRRGNQGLELRSSGFRITELAN